MSSVCRWVSRWSWMPVAAAVLVAAACAQAQDAEGGAAASSAGTVTVPGVGRAAAAPDVATLQVGVVSRAEQAQVALDANEEAAAKVVAALRDAGVAEKDLQTTSFRVSPVQDYEKSSRQRGEIVAYEVSHRVRATVRELPKLGALLDAAVRAGANQVDGIAFEVDDPTPLEARARRAAMADARKRAEELAAAEGLGIARLLRATEQDGGGPGPVRAMREVALAQGRGAVPVEPGEIELTVRVRAVYELAR